MGSVALGRVMQMAEAWPEYLQEELAAIAAEMDAGLRQESYVPSAAEWAGIERGLVASRNGEFATEDEISALIEKHRPR